MSTKELNCKSCNFIFGNEQLFNIHLKKCRQGVKNNDPKNSYSCPVCDGGRYFRLFSNLLRHQETKKHSDLLNWYLKQFKSTEETEETQEETPGIEETEEIVDSNIISNEIDNLKNFENDIEANLNLLEKDLNINSDSFFNKLEKDINQEIDTIFNENETNQKEVVEVEEVVEEEEEDDFIKNLIKEREKDLNNAQKNNPVPNIAIEKEQIDNKKQVQFNLNQDIQNAKEFIQENKMSLSIENSNDIEINDSILDIIQNQRTQEIINQSTKKPEPKKPEPKQSEVKKPVQPNQNNVNNNVNIQKYPPQMRETPIWKLLFKIINEGKPIDNFMVFMSKISITEYPKICAFIYFVEELETNLELKVQLIGALINIYNNFVKLINMRQFIYNGVNLLQVVGTMNTWKLNDNFINTKKSLN